MTALAVLNILRRFWWAIPIIALTIALGVTRSTLDHRTAALKAEQAAHAQDIADVRAATAKAQADDLMHARAVETRQAKISQEIQDDLTSRLASARADAARYAERLRAASQAHPGSVAATDMPGLPDAPSGAAGAGQDAIVDDAAICAENSVKAQGWQDWYRSASKAQP